jgi:hypothetical protein
MMTHATSQERRQNPALRDLFDTAYALIEPFFDPDTGWGGQSLEHLAFRVLRDNFPDLSGEEVRTVVVAAHRIYIQRYPARSEHLKRPGEFHH